MAVSETNMGIVEDKVINETDKLPALKPKGKIK